MSQVAIYKQPTHVNPMNCIDIEKYVKLLLGFGEAHLENLLSYMQSYNKTMGQISNIDNFNRKLERLINDFDYKFRTEMEIDELSIIVAYFEDVLSYVVEFLVTARRKQQFDKELNNCYEAIESLSKLTKR